VPHPFFDTAIFLAGKNYVGPESFSQIDFQNIYILQHPAAKNLMFVLFSVNFKNQKMGSI